MLSLNRIFTANGRQERVRLRLHARLLQFACERILELLDAALYLVGGKLTVTHWVSYLLVLSALPVFLSSMLLLVLILMAGSLG